MSVTRQLVDTQIHLILILEELKDEVEAETFSALFDPVQAAKHLEL